METRNEETTGMAISSEASTNGPACDSFAGAVATGIVDAATSSETNCSASASENYASGCCYIFQLYSAVDVCSACRIFEWGLDPCCSAYCTDNNNNDDSDNDDHYWHSVRMANALTGFMPY